MLGKSEGRRKAEGQRILACCSPWGHKDSDMTEQLKNNDNEKAT